MNWRLSVGCVEPATVVASVGISVLLGGAAAPTGHQADAGTQRLYDRAESDARASFEAARLTHGDGSLEAAAARDSLVQAIVLNGRGWTSAAETLARDAVRLRETLSGRMHLSVVQPLVNLGDALVAAGKTSDAIATLERAAAICDGLDSRAALPPVLDHLAAALISAGRSDEALRMAEQSLDIREDAGQAASSTLAATLETLALAGQQSGQFEKAGAALRRAVVMRGESESTDPEAVTTLNLLAQQLWFEGRLLESREASARALAAAQSALRSTHPVQAETMRWLAATLADIGDVEASENLRAGALALAEAEFGVGHPLTAEYHNSVARAEFDRGNYSAAKDRFSRALGMFESLYGQWHDRVATTRLNVAIAQAKLGDFVEAQRQHTRAIAIWERLGGKNHPFVAVALIELADALLEQGMAAAALPLLERAHAIRVRTLGSEHRDVARTLVELASVLAALGRATQAQQLADRAIRIWERLETPDAPESSRVFMVFAQLLARRGDLSVARDFYRRSLEIRMKVFGESNPASAEPQAGLALTLAHLRDPQATILAERAETIGREHLRLMLRTLPERQALQYAAVRPRGLHVLVSLAAEQETLANQALDMVIRGRALVLDEVARRHVERRVLTGDADEAAAAMATARQRLANLLVRGPGQMSSSQYAQLVGDTRQEGDKAEQALVERSAAFKAEQSQAQVGVVEVASALPNDAALVSFVRYDRSFFGVTTTTAKPDIDARAVRRTIPSYLAFVLRAGRQPKVVVLASTRSIDALVSQWRADLAADAIAPVERSEEATRRSSRTSGAALRRAVWDRLVPAIGDARSVLIVPDGMLGLVPFAALPVGLRSYLLERGPTIHYMTAERDIVGGPQSASTAGLLALGGASFDSRGRFGPQSQPPSLLPTAETPTRGGSLPCGDLGSFTFQPLSGTRQEVSDLLGVWPTAAGPARMLVGSDASERAFKREAPGRRVVHLATHGFFLSADCRVVAAGTRGVGGLSAVRRSRPFENPLQLSGLALAGANSRARAKADEDDGILTAEEVAMLDLQGVEWAVLSACDTGVGEVRAGEGVFGLRRAFQVAGARTVIMSLWSVDDQATRQWMRALYEGRFQRNLSTADAVHQASLSVLRDRRARGLSTHPFYWAAFVAAGDWR